MLVTHLGQDNDDKICVVAPTVYYNVSKVEGGCRGTLEVEGNFFVPLPMSCLCHITKFY